MKNQYKIVKAEDKKNIKIIDNENEFYLDINGIRIEGIKKYEIIRETNSTPILKLEIWLDEEGYNGKLNCKTSF